MNLHLEILPSNQQTALRQLGRPATECGFYLGGGTAIAAYLGHRQSQDLDWFTNKRIDDPLALARDLQRFGAELRVQGVQKATLHGDVGGVRASFLEYVYPSLAPPVPWSDLDCQIASLDDLAAMKLLAVDQRGAKRDFVDIHALALHDRPIPEMLELFRKKFAVEDISRVLYSLTYFDDADDDPMPRMLKSVDWEQIKADIRLWVKAAAARS